MVMQDIKSTKEKMDLLCEPFRRPCGSGGTMPSTSPPRCHWTPPSGEYLPRIAPANAMVIDFGVKNRVVALWKSLYEASIEKARNKPSTHYIEATSCVESSNATMKAEELS